MKFFILSSNWKYRSKINQYDSSVLEDIDVLISYPNDDAFVCFFVFNKFIEKLRLKTVETIWNYYETSQAEIWENLEE